VNAARRARARRLRQHLEAGTYRPNRSDSLYTRDGIAEAMAEDIHERPKLEAKVRDPHWAFHQPESPEPISLIEIMASK
jgi:hypothetical protein